MKTPTLGIIKAFLGSIDWRGHVELSDYDRDWLASELFDWMNPSKDKTRCDSCGNLATFVIDSRVGKLCDECIDDLYESVESMKEDFDD